MSNRLAIARVVALLIVAFASGRSQSRAAGGRIFDSGDGGSGGGKGCDSDVKNVNPSSTCLRSTWCGGAHGASLSYGPLSVTTPSGGGSVDCCLTEVVAPAHTEIIKGNKRIKHGSDVQGMLITRRCSSPFILFGIEIGSWTCETDTLTPFGSYPIDTAESCD